MTLGLVHQRGPSPEHSFDSLGIMDQARYLNGSFVTISMEAPHRGRIVIQEGSIHRVLWECDHDHVTGAEASACAGQEIGRSGRT